MRHTLFFLFLLFSTSLFSQNKNQSIGFRENKGQIIDQKGKPNPDVKFLLNTNGLNVQIKTNGFSYDIYETKKHPLTENQKAKQKAATFSEKEKNITPDYSLEYIYHRIDIDFVNSNPKVELVAEEKSKDYDNYYNVPNKPDGVLMVHQYQQITYKNIYPNIDVVFSIPKDSLKAVEYNFVVHPKGKISDIQLKFNGAKTDLVDNKIKIQVRFGQMDETLPMSWTEEGELKKEIAVGYTKIKNNVYGFESSENVSGKTVVIDPVPTRLWGTYYSVNFTSSDSNSITVDNNGNVFFTGQANSFNNIATSGAFQTFLFSGSSAFIVKLNQSGQRLWGTFVSNSSGSASGYTNISDAIVNSKNELYIVGDTFNTNPTTAILTTDNSFKKFESGFNNEGLMMKFDTNGQRIWGTFYGGEGNDRIRTISLDSNENIIIAGETYSKIGISTPNAYQQNIVYAFYGCGFIAKFTATGARTYGTYFPGKINHSAVDNNDNLIFAGQYMEIDTFTPNITTPGIHQNQIHNMDGFILKLNSTGEQRLWCTYYGGDASFSNSVSDYSDQIKGLGIDALNNIYITGLTNSINLIATTGAFKSTQIAGSVDSFVAKFNSTGQIQWGTYFGSDISLQSDDKCSSGFVSSNGDIYITGNTRSDKNISTPNSYQTSMNGSDEGFITKFKTNGEIEWSTYYGSEYQDFPQDIFLKNNKLYIIGDTTYSGFKSLIPFGTIGTYDPYGYGLFIAEFQDCLSSPQTTSNSPICIGNTLELKASGGTNYSWTGPNGFTSTNQNPTISNATGVNNGQYSCSITGTGGCDGVVNVDVVVGDNQPPVPNIATLPTITGDCKTQITTIPTATDACAGVITATTTSPLSYNLPGTYTIVWNYDDGNSVTQNQTVIISSKPLPTTTTPQTFCIQQNATVNSITITGQNIKWYDALTNGNSLANTTLLQNGLTYYASQTINGCESERTPVLINIQNTLAPTGDANQAFCTSQNPTIANIQITGNLIKWYDNSTNGNFLPTTTNLQNGKTYYASQTINDCESERFGVAVSIVNTPLAPTGNSNQSYCKKENATLKDIQIAGQNIKWYDTNFAAAPLPETTLLENNKTYHASQTIGCESDRTPISIQVYNTPSPTGVNNQQFCMDENATISNLNIVGSNIKWYDQSSNGNIVSETTLLQNGKTYFATQTLNNCESERLAIVVKIQDTPIPLANSQQIFCIQKNAKISDIAITGQNINWFESDSSSINLSESTPLQNGTTYYASQTISNCESDRIPILITILEATTEDCIDFVDELPYPKFFTPNNDSYNDTWTIDFAYLKTNTGIKIFDRYGKLLKIINSTSDSWNGTYNGAELPATDYWFLVTRANGKEHKGHFSLKR